MSNQGANGLYLPNNRMSPSANHSTTRKENVAKESQK
jgi:hypothetical protein